MAEIKKPEQGEVEREAFEAEWGKRWPGSFKPRGDGSYVSNWTQCAWEAWQARAALASATPPADSTDSSGAAGIKSCDRPGCPAGGDGPCAQCEGRF